MQFQVASQGMQNYLVEHTGDMYVVLYIFPSIRELGAGGRA